MPLRSLSVALALVALSSCAKGPDRNPAPTTLLHYPGWIATWDDQLLVVNLDQDLAFDGGALGAFDDSGDVPAGTALGGVALPNMPGGLRVVQASDLAGCTPDASYPFPMALVAGRTEQRLYAVGLQAGAAPTCPDCGIDLDPFSASAPLDVQPTCGTDGHPRVFVSYEVGKDSLGYMAQVDLSTAPPTVTQVLLGLGTPRNLAYDPIYQRLYVTNKEESLRAALRWVDVGTGCKKADDGVQDEAEGGCHVDTGWNLSSQEAGAEPNGIALSSSADWPCTAPGYGDRLCRRAYLSVRLYDYALASYQGSRPSSDIGGQLWVVELPEGGLGQPEPQLVRRLDIGVVAGAVQVIPRTGMRDLVAVTAADDHLLWLYDDDAGAMVKVFGRNASGVPDLGHRPFGLATRDLGGGTVRLFVSSYEDHLVRAVDIPLDDPASAALVETSGGDIWQIEGIE